MARRQVIHVKGMGHGDNPIPVATKIGNMLFSGGIGGNDTESGQTPDELEGQVRNMFANVRKVLEAAGLSAGDVAKITVYQKSTVRDRSILNKEWVAMFPDDEDRPVRHTLTYDGLAGNRLVQCEVIAVLP